jgi:hypothetical protein
MKDDLISTLGPLFLLGIIVFTIWMVRILQAYLVPILTSIPMSPEMDLCYRCLSKAIAEERMSVAEEIAYADAISKEQLDLDKP